jgi:peptidoglycan hydrolase-like protein with peptidoglycan-binding domain
VLNFNAAVSKVQRKPALSTPDDPYEREADQIADTVLRMPQPSGRPDIGMTVSPNAPLSRASSVPRTGAPVPLKTTGAPPVVHAALNSPGQPLDHATRAFFEPRFDADFSRVRVHTDDRADVAARAIDARAFTLGADVAFAKGEFDPRSQRGKNLLAHELAHTLQQDQSGLLRRKALTAEEKQENLQSPFLRDDARLQQAFDNSPLLKKNETSDGVKTLQRALKELDYLLPKSFAKTGDADGIFDDETFTQVKQFQRDNHLSDDGIVGRDTLRALDSKFNPTVTIQSVYIGQDRRELIKNETDWGASGPKYVDWPAAPYHIVFNPGEMFGDAIPVSVPAGATISAMAKVSVKGGIPGRTYKIAGTPLDPMPGWTLTGEGTHREDFDTDYIYLEGEGPLTNKLAFEHFFVHWRVDTSASRMSGGASSTGGVVSEQKVFVTSGAAFNTSEMGPGGDAPNVPTFRRLRRAMRFAAGTPSTQADRIVYQVFKRFPNYGVCDVPPSPNVPPGFSCPVLSSIWGMSDHVRTGNFQCITISRYVNAVLNVLGVPHAVENLTAKPVVIWADPAHKEQGRDNDYPHPGIGIPSIVHPHHPDWPLGLLDGNCGINNYEACVKLQWKPPGQNDIITQYYCGGLGEENPPEGFKTPREVLNSAFVLAYFSYMAKPDPDTGFPRGIRREDVKVYDPSVKCHHEL